MISRRQFLEGGALLIAGGVLLGGCGTSTSSSSSPSTAASTPVRGGKLRVGTAFGGSTDTLDPGKATSEVDFYRVGALFDPLCYLDQHLNMHLLLAESMEPNQSGTVWTIKLLSGVTWHDGKPLTADDVIYTIQRNAKLQLIGTNATAVIDIPKLKKLDTLTVQVPLTVARADFSLDLASTFNIVQAGATDFKHPIGTGAFQYVSFTPGQTSLFKRNPSYFISGQPYLDSLEISTISDGSARLNALLAGQVDAVDQLTFASARQYAHTKSFHLLQSPAGSFNPITMACDTPPFNDVRVRQAMRLIADRQAMVNTSQLGYGAIGNDLAGEGEPDYDTQLPQRTQDIEQAKALLKAAGREGLKVTLNTSAVGPGMLEAATAYAQQATAAGVNVVLNNLPAANFYGSQYLKYPFGMSGWVALPVVSFMAGALAKQAPFNETHWYNAQFDSLYSQARATLDSSLREQLLFEAQKMLWNEGGYLLWGFIPYLDAVANNVHTPPPSATGNLCGILMFREFWIG